MVSGAIRGRPYTTAMFNNTKELTLLIPSLMSATVRGRPWVTVPHCPTNRPPMARNACYRSRRRPGPAGSFGAAAGSSSSLTGRLTMDGVLRKLTDRTWGAPRTATACRSSPPAAAGTSPSSTTAGTSRSAPAYRRWPRGRGGRGRGWKMRCPAGACRGVSRSRADRRRVCGVVRPRY